MIWIKNIQTNIRLKFSNKLSSLVSTWDTTNDGSGYKFQLVVLWNNIYDRTLKFWEIEYIHKSSPIKIMSDKTNIKLSLIII